jgi:hypothetical protein
MRDGMLPVQNMKDTETCDFCGEILEGLVHYQGLSGVSICITCVQNFFRINYNYEEETKKMRHSMIVNFPVPKHNFKVIQGGLSDDE